MSIPLSLRQIDKCPERQQYLCDCSRIKTASWPRVVRVDTSSFPVCAGVFARVIMFRHHCQNAHLRFPDHWPWLLAAVPILPGRRHHWPCLHLVTRLGAASTAASHSIKVILPINYVYVRCFGDYQQVRENSFEFLFFRWFRYNSTSVDINKIV